MFLVFRRILSSRHQQVGEHLYSEWSAVNSLHHVVVLPKEHKKCIILSLFVSFFCLFLTPLKILFRQAIAMCSKIQITTELSQNMYHALCLVILSLKSRASLHNTAIFRTLRGRKLSQIVNNTLNNDCTGNMQNASFPVNDLRLG